MQFLGASCKTQLRRFCNQGSGLLAGGLPGHDLLPEDLGEVSEPHGLELFRPHGHRQADAAEPGALHARWPQRLRPAA